MLYKFLSNFLEFNEVTIQITIEKSILQNDKIEQAEKYK